MPASPLDQLNPEQKKGLSLFLTYALEKGWQTIDVNLPGLKDPQTLSRNSCQDFLGTETAKWLGPGKIGALDNAQELAKTRQLLLDETRKQLDLTSTDPYYQTHYKNYLRDYDEALQKLSYWQTGRAAVTVPSLNLVSQATQAKLNLESSFDREVRTVVDSQLHDFFRPEFRAAASQTITSQVREAAFKRLESNGQIDKDFIQGTLRPIIYKNVWASAAIKNHQQLEQGLLTTLSGQPNKVATAGKDAFLANYNSVRNFQLGLDEAYHPLLFRLTNAGLTPTEAQKVIADFSAGWEQEPLVNRLNSYQTQHFLRTALANPEIRAKLSVSPDTLASEFALFGASHVQSRLLNQQALGLKTDPLALAAFQHGLTTQQLRNFGYANLATQVEILQARFLKPQTSQEKQVVWQRQQNLKLQQKWENKFKKQAAWNRFLDTTKRGQLIRGTSRVLGGVDKVLDLPARPLRFAERFVGTQIGQGLARMGLHGTSEALITGGLKGAISHVGGKLATKLLGKALTQKAGAVIGTALGGPVGTVLGSIAGAFLSAENLKKLGEFLGGLGLGLMLFLKSHFFAFAGALAGFAVGGPIGAFIGGGLGFLADSLGAAKLAGSALETGAGLGYQAAALPQVATAAPEAAGLGLLGPAGGAIWVPGVAGILSLFSTAAIIGSMFVPPAKEVGGGISYNVPQNIRPMPKGDNCQDVGCQLANALEACGATNLVISQSTWNNLDLKCLINQGISQKAINDLHHSVFEIENNSVLQCVGFKVAAEKLAGVTLTPKNAVAFLTDYKNNPGKPAVGANAVWGPRTNDPDLSKRCPTDDPVKANSLCESNLYCCGHVGIVSKVYEDGSYDITSANLAGAGEITTVNFPPGAGPEDGGPWQFLKL